MKNRMKYSKLLCSLIFSMLLFVACSDDKKNEDLLPPEITLTSDTGEGLPGENMNIIAEITDDVGIRSILIESPDWEFSEKIVFSDQNMITKYDLHQGVIIPLDATRGSSSKVTIIISDYADHITKKNFTINVVEEPARLDIKHSMGFNIIVDGGIAVVTDNDVTFKMSEEVTLPVELTLESNKTKLKTLKVVCSELGIEEIIELSDIATDEGKKATFKKNYSLKGTATELKFEFTLEDEENSSVVYSPMVFIKSTFAAHNERHKKIFTYDTSIDLSKVIFGLPMLGEAKSSETYKFTVRYYSPKANTNVIFVSGKDKSRQVKYGLSNDRKYIIKSDAPIPFILEKQGYYEISFDLLLGSYDIKEIGGIASPYQNMYIGGSFDGYSGQEMSKIDDSKYAIDWTFASNADLTFGIGGGEWVLATGDSSSDPEIWLLKADRDKYPGASFFDVSVPKSSGRIVFDTFLFKAYMISE